MTTWVLIANRDSARILNRLDGYLEDVERLACTKPSPPDPELPCRTAASTFALRLAAHLERARQRSSFEQLVLVAEPGFLELLRMWLSKHVLELVVASIPTDTEVPLDFAPVAGAISASVA